LSEVDFKKRFVEGYILATILKGDNYIYKILESLNAFISLKEINDGSIYKIMQNMEKNKLIKGEMRENSYGARRRYYTITRTGMVYLNNFKEYYISFVKKTNALLFDENKL